MTQPQPPVGTEQTVPTPPETGVNNEDRHERRGGCLVPVACIAAGAIATSAALWAFGVFDKDLSDADRALAGDLDVQTRNKDCLPAAARSGKVQFVARDRADEGIKLDNSAYTLAVGSENGRK